MAKQTQARKKSAKSVVVDKDVGEDELGALLKKSFRPKTNEASSTIKSAVSILADYTTKGKVKVSGDVIRTIESLIADIDESISRQMDVVLHNEKFLALESAWRGIDYLVHNTSTSEHQKIRVLNISKQELSRQLRRYKGSVWDQSPLFKSLYEQEFGQFGGEPFGCLIGDYYFDHSPHDVALLSGISKIAAAMHCPFISAASPSVMQMNDWDELANPRDVGKIFTTPEYGPWRMMRQSHDSRYVALTLPRFLARQPYGAKTVPVEDFTYEEKVSPENSMDFCWANAAYAMAVNINRAFKEYGWCSKIRGIESGGAVEDLPTYTFPSDDGGYELSCPTEIAISDRREHELSNVGFLPLVHRKHTDFAAFIGSRTLNDPTIYEDPDATANARLSSRLPYIFATCRFAHYLKCIVRDKIGSFKERDDMQQWLNDWLMNYVDGDPSLSTDETKARRPLSAAEVKVEENPEDPGYYQAHFFLRPHYQLEGLTVSLRLVSKLPSAKREVASA